MGQPRSKGPKRDAIEGVVALVVIVGLVLWASWGFTQMIIWAGTH